MMKWLLSIIFFLYISNTSTRKNVTFKGTVIINDETFVGANITCARKNTMTDAQGNFMINIENYSGQDLVIRYPGCPDLIIKNIHFNSENLFDLGKIKMINYRMISVDEYKKVVEIDKTLGVNNEKACHPIYCYSQLLGYVTEDIDTTELTSYWKNKQGQLIRYSLDKKLKSIYIDYKNIVEGN